MEFKAFDKIQHIGKLYMSITQKLHGTNAQIYICQDFDGKLHAKAGSRTRWLTPEDDNYGFARFVQANEEELTKSLGEGRHYGEWCGPGINAGEGLPYKQLFLFDWRRWNSKDLPNSVRCVPVLYKGAISTDAINNAMHLLKTQGSQVTQGFMKPEGIVIEIDNTFYKNVFDLEEVRWTAEKKPILSKIYVDVSHLLQPLRLEKLLSRDERYLREYPVSLPTICSDYVKDLIEEKQLIGVDEESIEMQKKQLGRELFKFVKNHYNKILPINFINGASYV